MLPRQKQEYIKDALFISHTSLKDFLKCPRAYYLKNIYKQESPFSVDAKPHPPFKLQIASPYLTLGGMVHDAIGWFLGMNGRVTEDQLMQQFRNYWRKYRGKKGGFSSLEEEASFGKRGLKMLQNFFNNAKELEKSAPNVVFPKYNLTGDVILTGNFDFVGELPDGTLHIVDFKTGAHDEEDAIQLYIYAILAESNFGKPVSKASFWYLDREDKPKEIVLDSLEPKLDWLKEKAVELKQAVQGNKWVCVKEDLCRDCRDYQAIIDGKGEFQLSDYRYKKDIYYLKK